MKFDKETQRTFKCYQDEVISTSPPRSTLTYVWEIFVHLFYTFLTDWTMPITRPINFFFTCIFYPAAISIILVMSFGIRIINYFGLFDYINWFDNNEWGGYNGDKLKQIRENGMIVLGSPVPNPPQPIPFNIDLVETLLFFSSVVYYRGNPNYNKMTDTTKSTIKKRRNDAEKTIVEIIRPWGIKFHSFGELSSTENIFAGLFWSHEKNFIVVSFKGSSPPVISDFITDFLFNRVDAQAFVYGMMHQGFYYSLFNDYDDNSKSCTANSLVEVILKKVEKWNNPTPVNIWLTGHSLGGSLAQAFYARLIKIQSSLGKKIVVRDAVVFGSLTLGDLDFASSFHGMLNLKTNEHRTLWRIIGDDDVAARVPPRHLLKRFRQYVTKEDVMNYYLIGNEMQFFHDGRKPKTHQI
ncbi:7113_t:CDS:2 [Dentiscutata erythropus]|uniref:7113_t:CDS:1 n=1 Tax=Dentiscutata erythropus TaxID=1348616 RepID=A0A9N9F0T6_9GLOM|nr:7113_t:CDS:2 [Dentiscutata erythropus]